MRPDDRWWVKTRSPLSKPYVRFSREQSLVAPLAKLVAFYSQMAERRRGQREAVNRIVSGENFWGGVAWGDQDFRGPGPGAGDR